MVKAAERTRTVDIVCDYFRIFYSALVGEGRRPFSKQRRIVINGPPEIITLGDIPDQAPIFHVNAPRQFVRDKRLEPREPPRFYFVGFFIQTSTKLPSPSSLNRTPFIVPSAWILLWRYHPPTSRETRLDRGSILRPSVSNRRSQIDYT